MSFLQNSIAYLKGVGPQKAIVLANELGINTYQDLLQHFPFKHIDKTIFNTISQLQANMEYVQLQGSISNYYEAGEKHQKRLIAVFNDHTGSIELVWFKGISWVCKNLVIDKDIVVYGKLSTFMNKHQVMHPEMEMVEDKPQGNKIAPIYPGTERLKIRGLVSKNISKLMKHLLQIMPAGVILENIPASILKQENLMDKEFAIRQIHFPETWQHLAAAKRRLIFEEFFIAQVRLANIRSGRYKHSRGILFKSLGINFNKFYYECLPFELTNAQKRVLKEIRRDTIAGYQMNRLLQGDVGSGKTIVALIVALIAIDNNCQACIMAPTEILANQHFETITQLTKSLNLNLGILTSSVKGLKRKKILEQLKNNEIDLLIGTHSLVEKTVEFKHLGLAVIDEQHKFGVMQRSALWQKNDIAPHILVMTATPIPRTLAMTAYGDLDCSVIDELPPNRKSIITAHRFERERPLLIDFMKKEIKEGRQIYVVFPLIEESETLDYQNLLRGIEIYETYFREPNYFISVVHGQQNAALKDANMQRFIKGETQIMLSTTVIEVGVNVPNASIMIIESAEKFGLSQLHQLRGRVGRGTDKSYCILLTGIKLSNDAKQRISTICSTNDGFIIAEKDLEIRGPGDIEGTKQSGLLNFKIANLMTDKDILDLAKDKADKLFTTDAELKEEENIVLKNFLLLDNAKKNLWQKIS